MFGRRYSDLQRHIRLSVPRPAFHRIDRSMGGTFVNMCNRVELHFNAPDDSEAILKRSASISSILFCSYHGGYERLKRPTGGVLIYLFIAVPLGRMTYLHLVSTCVLFGIGEEMACPKFVGRDEDQANSHPNILQACEQRRHVEHQRTLNRRGNVAYQAAARARRLQRRRRAQFNDAQRSEREAARWRRRLQADGRRRRSYFVEMLMASMVRE